MADEREEASCFKVVDRRNFSPEGVRRGDDPESKRNAEPERLPPPDRVGAVPSPIEDESEAESFERELTGFETLVTFLATTAWFQLGLVPGPGGERIQADFVNARRTIDMLEVLDAKTQGNLAAGEQKMLEDVLYELRMGFVEVEKRASSKRK